MSAAKNFSVSISYPPLSSSKGYPFLSQNRQFQWTHTDNIIYPVIPASAATLLSQNGYFVFWDDAIAEKLTFKQWFFRLLKNKPSLIAIETKTPVIKKHWQIIQKIKEKLPRSTIVLMGDHVTALPLESFTYSAAKN
jgi:anaerobic magnesium-protoporphyrin IX monomethyl ester cyclase